MAEYLIQDTTLTGIADAIRGKTGDTGEIAVNDMASKISAIVSGGGGAGLEDVSTEAGMDEVLTAENIGKAYRYTGATGDKYVSGDIYIVEEAT